MLAGKDRWLLRPWLSHRGGLLMRSLKRTDDHGRRRSSAGELLLGCRRRPGEQDLEGGLIGVLGVFEGPGVAAGGGEDLRTVSGKHPAPPPDFSTGLDGASGRNHRRQGSTLDLGDPDPARCAPAPGALSGDAAQTFRCIGRLRATPAVEREDRGLWAGAEACAQPFAARAPGVRAPPRATGTERSSPTLI
jgi:hypothetical protein